MNVNYRISMYFYRSETAYARDEWEEAKDFSGMCELAPEFTDGDFHDAISDQIFVWAQANGFPDIFWTFSYKVLFKQNAETYEMIGDPPWK